MFIKWDEIAPRSQDSGGVTMEPCLKITQQSAWHVRTIGHDHCCDCCHYPAPQVDTPIEAMFYLSPATERTQLQHNIKKVFSRNPSHAAFGQASFYCVYSSNPDHPLSHTASQLRVPTRITWKTLKTLILIPST